MSRLTARIASVSPVVVDRVIAVAVFALVLVDGQVNGPSALGGRVLLALGAALAGGALLLRRTQVARCVALFLVAATPEAVAVGADAWTLPVAFVLSYSIGRHASGWRMLAILAVLDAGVVASTGFGDGVVNDVAFDLLVPTGLPTVAGVVMRRRAALVDELTVQRRALEQERDARVRDATSAERVRIARELHDVVVHDVSAMVAQAAAARHIVGSRPGEAAAAIGRVEGAGREALDELRRTLGVLRATDRALALEPQPTLARLSALVARGRESGAAVELHADDALDGLPADLQLAAYRVVEEILEAAGPALHRAAVRVRRQGAELRVEVEHDGPPPQDEELSGARARVAIFAGRLDVEQPLQGGCRVCAGLPLPISHA